MFQNIISVHTWHKLLFPVAPLSISNHKGTRFLIIKGRVWLFWLLAIQIDTTDIYQSPTLSGIGLAGSTGYLFPNLLIILERELHVAVQPEGVRDWREIAYKRGFSGPPVLNWATFRIDNDECDSRQHFINYFFFAEVCASAWYCSQMQAQTISIFDTQHPHRTLICNNRQVDTR